MRSCVRVRVLQQTTAPTPSHIHTHNPPIPYHTIPHRQQRCAQLPTAAQETKFSETTCHPEASFYFEMDKEARIFVVCVDKAYPARLAFLAVEGFRAEVRVIGSCDVWFGG